MNRIAISSLLLLAFLTIPAWAAAQDEPAAAAEPEAPPEPLWSGQTGLSYLATSGNSDTETVGLDFQAIRRPNPWGLEVGARFDRAEQESVKTAERFFAALRGSRSLAERWDAFVGLSAERDDFAGFDLRALVELGAVYNALLGPRHVLDVDFGLTWTDEDRLPPEIDDSWLGGVAGLRYKWAISDGASFSQGLRGYANFDETDGWRAESVTAVTAALNERLALRFSYEVRFRNMPIGLNDDTDTTTKVSLVWNL